MFHIFVSVSAQNCIKQMDINFFVSLDNIIKVGKSVFPESEIG